MKRCINCGKFLNCDRADKEIKDCKDFVKKDMTLKEKEEGYFRFERVEE